MSIWFEGTGHVDCDLDHLKGSLDDLGEFYVGVVRAMPGITSAELVEQGTDHVVIRTNAGVMRRTNISPHVDDRLVVVEYDEVYEAGARVTMRSHFVDEFIECSEGLMHRVVVSDVDASGILGAMYRRLGRARMGAAFLSSHRAHLEVTSRGLTSGDRPRRRAPRR